MGYDNRYSSLVQELVLYVEKKESALDDVALDKVELILKHKRFHNLRIITRFSLHNTFMAVFDNVSYIIGNGFYLHHGVTSSYKSFAIQSSV